MSIETYVVSGYGFYTQDITPNNLYKFLVKHPCKNQVIQDITNILQENNNEDGISDSDWDILDRVKDQTDSYSIAEVVGLVIREETEIDFSFNSLDDYDYEALLLEPLYPWQFTDKELTLTQEKVEKLLNPYAEELGVNGCQYIDLTYTS